ncbi:hypothetical protein J1605_000667 [Eschrichtius robustus]|uniref:Uncharacterized protein n=1 Tax=Eschrichtius robustus TaxID=9764 RepID=A0AB34GMG7_ESCRO|nr:hypothetical protein J1605_000667 [Eschrichtius robustus]
MHAGLGAGGPGRTAPPSGPRPPAPEELASCACAAEAAVPVSEGESVPDFEGTAPPGGGTGRGREHTPASPGPWPRWAEQCPWNVETCSNQPPSCDQKDPPPETEMRDHGAVRAAWA